MNTMQKLGLLATTVAVATQAHAGEIADAIKDNTVVQGAQADLMTVGGVVAGFVAIAVVFGAAFRLFRKGG